MKDILDLEANSLEELFMKLKQQLEEKGFTEAEIKEFFNRYVSVFYQDND